MSKDNMPPLPEPDEKTRRGLAFSGFAMHAYAQQYAEQRVRAQSLADEELMREAMQVLPHVAGFGLVEQAESLVERLRQRLGE